MAKGATPAKLAPPRPQRAIERSRLFSRLDGPPGRFWICGPGGSGKTFLAATWLASRGYRALWIQLDEDDAEPRTLFHYIAQAFSSIAPRHAARIAALARAASRDNLGVFARGFSRKLYELLPPRVALVFDHFESVAEHSAPAEALAMISGEAPASVPVLVIGRTDLPVAFAVLRSREEIVVLGWQDLKFTLEESRHLVAARHNNVEAERLHGLADGWAAGVVLMSEWLEQHKCAALDPELQQQALFDYFAHEFLNGVSPPVREFLFAAAQLPSVTAQAAAAVSGTLRADDILADLARHPQRGPVKGAVRSIHGCFCSVRSDSCRIPPCYENEPGPYDGRAAAAYRLITDSVLAVRALRRNAAEVSFLSLSTIVAGYTLGFTWGALAEVVCKMGSVGCSGLYRFPDGST